MIHACIQKNKVTFCFMLIIISSKQKEDSDKITLKWNQHSYIKRAYFGIRTERKGDGELSP